jgi:glucokinase
MTSRLVTHLLADIGGTNARFALSRDGTMFGFKSLPVDGHAGFGPALHSYLQTFPDPVVVDRAMLAVAGPVAGNRCALTNSPWIIDGSMIERDFGIDRVSVYNDLEAVAWAIPELEVGDCISLGDGHSVPQAPQLIIAPGTGLGVAAWLGAGRALASEGGHSSFAPEDAEEDRLLQTLRSKHGHVSVERLVSGPGLVAIYTALAAQAGKTATLSSAADITTQAMAGACVLSHAAVMHFCAILGSAAGNLALTFGANGGVYIAGGIAPKIVPLLARSPFRQRFATKGRLSQWLLQIPTKIIRRPDAALVGLWERYKQECLA